jgi:hypothetical protein
MTNPASAMRMLITYAVVVPLAILVGYLLTDPLDYGTLGFFGIVILLLLSPIFIRWHYPILVFGLGCPAICFFLVGAPPLWEVVALLSLGIALVERTLSSRRFLSVPVAAWPLLYIAAMAYVTSRLTGGIGLHQLGGEGGGGKKYLLIFIGLAAYLALTSRVIPKEKRNLYIGLWVLAGAAQGIGELAALLGGPFHAFNLLFPSNLNEAGASVGTTRLGTLGQVFGALTTYMVVRYGLRGIFMSRHLWRPAAFLLLFPFTMLGGFRSFLIGALAIYTLMFFLEGLHRTRLMPLLLLVGLLVAPALAFFSDQLPLTFQRSMSFLPLKWDASVVADAEGSTAWRENMWAALWPQVPGYLLLGKGHNLSTEDFQMIGGGAFAGQIHSIDAGQGAFAISGDYHSGPLSTLIPFGIWGAIGILWLFAVSLFVAYRNYRYGDPELQTFNAFFLAVTIWAVFGFFFVFGAFENSVVDGAKGLGFSLALNWGVCRPAPRPVSNPRIKPLPVPAPLPQPA